jgi:hypothetical protein
MSVNRSTARQMRLSILFRNARDLELQLFELNELRYQVRQAELLARKSRRAHRSSRGPRYSVSTEPAAAQGGLR